MTQTSTEPQTITIGRIVTYRSRTGNYDVPAIVCRTEGSTYQDSVDKGILHALEGDTIDLIVFSPGPGGMRAEATDFKAESEHGRAENEGGTYAEWGISYDPEGAPGTWRWPERA